MTTDPLLLNILDKIDATGQITRADQMVLTATLVAKSTIALADSGKLQNIYDRLTRGAIQLVD
ncbi:MAG: hypothetical protein F6J87_25800 [Spirulina sp. SIO3F2]|nr:hypothetical protein [Spirulina sp. SIO3F2]